VNFRMSALRRSIANANHDVISTQYYTLKINEYEWPPDSGNKYVLTEQLIAFLDFSGNFKRKFPTVPTRKLEQAEIKHLFALEYLNESQYSIGVSVMSLVDALDLMKNEFTAKYEDYIRYKMKDQHKTMIVEIPAEEMPAQLRKATKSVASFNKMLNQMRRESCQSYYEPNTNRLHLPLRQFKTLKEWQTRKTPYPVPVLSGQFQHDYKAYSPEQLRKLPLTSCLEVLPVEGSELALTVFDDDELRVDPMEELVSDAESEINEEETKEEIKDEVTAENGEADDDGERLKGKEEEEEAESDGSGVSEDVCCTCRERYNPEGDKFARCTVCDRSSHTACLGLTDDQHEVIQTYAWACIECKKCTVCAQSRNEEQILFCDRCDRGFHTFCVALRRLPKDEIWICRFCFKDDPGYSERKGGKRMRERRKKKALREFMDP